MLLSFERPAASPAGAFSADLENCTAMPTSASTFAWAPLLSLAASMVPPLGAAPPAAVTDRGNGYHRAANGGLITVKIGRAHGGCLGTRSR